MVSTVAGKSTLWFAEDGQTFYVPNTTEGQNHGTTECPCPVGHPEFQYKWCLNGFTHSACPDAAYRKCCSARWWFGEAMAAMIMGLRATWGHEAYFEYIDRYRQWSALPQPPQFHRDMYDTHRDNYTPAKKTWQHS